MWAEGRAEREGENLKQTLCGAQSPTQSLILLPWDHDPSQNQERNAEPTEPPPTPSDYIFK